MTAATQPTVRPAAQSAVSSATATRPATSTTWQIDPTHSLVEFSVRHMMVSTAKGRFTDLEGTIDFNPTDPTSGSAAVQIKTASIATGDTTRDGHLRSPDFFNAEQFPIIAFNSTRVEPIGEDRLRIVGDLTIRDITREVVLDAEINGRGTSPYGKSVAGFSARTSFNRKDFGLEWNVGLETGGVLVSDTVKINLEIEATA